MLKRICCLLIALASLNLWGSSKYDHNVILLTFDGVRSKDFFGRKTDPLLSSENIEIMPLFWSRRAQEGIILGDEASDSSMVVANNTGISYPAYLSMMSGVFTQQCQSNYPVPECDGTVETLPERLLREKNLDRSEVAVFASWERISDAAETRGNNLIVSVARSEFVDPNYPQAHRLINLKMKENLKKRYFKENERDDETTFEHGITYLKNNRPKFLWISLLDSDSFAHSNKYKDYVTSLNTYDLYIERLIEELDKMGNYGKKTTIVITTDHGRGEGIHGWMHHGVFEAKRGHKIGENSRKIWAYIRGPATPGLGKLKDTHYSHLSLRPTMEKLLGLRPVSNDIIQETFVK